MKRRAIILAMVMTVALVFALVANGGARWQRAEGLLLDFLLANVRERFEKQAVSAPENVVFVEFKEKDKAEFSAWPPAPIDWIMVLRKLKPHDPAVVAIAEVLKWDAKEQQFVDELQQTLIAFPQVALACSAVIGGTAESGMVSEDKQIPQITRVDGDTGRIPKLSRFVYPDARLCTQMQLGFAATDLNRPDNIPALLVARAEDRIVPSFATQMTALFTREPYATQRLHLGSGAGLYLGREKFIPLSPDGTANALLKDDITRLNALDLITPEPGDETARFIAEKLGKNKLVILGTTPSTGETHARLAAWALALPPLAKAASWPDWMAALLVALLAWRQLHFGRMGALIAGGCGAALLLAVSLMTFQSTLVWWAPLLPGVLLIASTGFCALWPRQAP